MPIAATQKTFLLEVLRVKPKKKNKLLSKGKGDDQTQATTAFKEFRQKEKAVSATIARLNAIAGSEEDVAALEGRVARAQQLPQSAVKGNAADVKAKCDQAAADLDGIDADAKAAISKHKANQANLVRLSKERDAYTMAATKARTQLELLAVIPRSNPDALRKQLEDAEATAKADTVEAYQSARESLADFKDKFNKEKALAEGLQGGELKQMEAKPKAQEQLADKKALLARLELLPGIDDTVRAYTTIITAAETLAKEDKWTQTAAKLKELEGLPNESELQAKSTSQQASLESSGDYATGKKLLTRLGTLQPDSAVAPFETAFQGVVKRILGAGGRPAIKELAPVVAQLQAEVDRCATLTATVTGSKDVVEAKLTELRGLTTPVELGPLESQFESLGVALRAKMPEQADVLARRLNTELDGALPARREALNKWNAVKGQVDAVEKALDALGTNSKCEPVSTEARTFKSLVLQKAIGELTAAHDWTKLLDNYTRASQKSTELTARDKAFTSPEIAEVRGKADKQVQSSITAAAAAIDALQAAIDAAGKKVGEQPANATADLKGDLATVKAAWAKILKGATEEKELKLDETMAKLAAIQKKAEAENTPEAVKARLGNHQQEKARKLFETDWAVLQSGIVKLQAFDNTTAATFTKEATALRNGASADWVAGVSGLAKLNSQVGAAQEKARGNQEAVKKEVETLAAKVQEDIDKKKSSAGKKFKDLFDSLTTEREELALLGGSTNLAALQEAKAGLLELQKRIAALEPTEANGGASFDSVVDKLDEEKKELEKVKKQLEENHPKGLKTLNERVSKLDKDIYTQEPATTMKQLTEFAKERVEAVASADKVVEVRKQFKEKRKQVKASLEVFTSRKQAPAYAKSLQKRLDAAVELAEKPDELVRANLQLKTIDEELSKALLEAATALKKEGELLNKKQADEAAKVEWERSLKLFNSKQLDQAREAVAAKKGDKALIKEVQRMVTVAEETAEKGDHAKALSQLRLAQKRVQEIVQDPYGPAIGSRNNLPKDEQVYQEALKVFQEQLAAFPKAVAKEVPTLPGSVESKLSALVNKVKVKFDPNAFSSVLIQVGSEEIDDNKRRAAREVALAKIRGVQNVLDKDPLIQSLLENPISKALPAAAGRLDAALTRLEANVSRCCK